METQLAFIIANYYYYYIFIFTTAIYVIGIRYTLQSHCTNNTVATTVINMA